MEYDLLKNEICEIKNQVRRQARLLRWSALGWVAVLSVGILGAAYKQLGGPFYPEIKVGRLALVDKNGVERLLFTADNDQVRYKGQIYPRISPATGIVLQNAVGDEIGGLAMLDNGTTAITIDAYSPNGEAYERASLFVRSDGGSGVFVGDQNGKARTCIGVDPEMNTIMDLADSNSDRRISAKIRPDGKSIFRRGMAKGGANWKSLCPAVGAKEIVSSVADAGCSGPPPIGQHVAL